MKKVVKLIEEHCRKHGIDAIRGLDVTTDYLIDCFDIRHYFKENGWEQYMMQKKAESEELFQVMMIWFEKVTKAIEGGGWIDFFGGIYEETYQSRSKASSTGQFFTPPPVCDLLAHCCGGVSDDRVSDCACGSGRTLLAQWAHSDNKKAYYIGEDIDYQSVKMCALNLMIHGARGKVIRHDTLCDPILFDYGFEINEIRYPLPTPYYSLRKIHYTKEDVKANNEKLYKKYGDNVRKEKILSGGELIDVYYKPQEKEVKVEQKEVIKPKEVVEKNVEPIQLSLF